MDNPIKKSSAHLPIEALLSGCSIQSESNVRNFNSLLHNCDLSDTLSTVYRHPNVLHLVGVSPLNSKIAFLVFDAGSYEHVPPLKMRIPTIPVLIDTEWAVESMIASALHKGLNQSLHVGVQTV